MYKKQCKNHITCLYKWLILEVASLSLPVCFEKKNVETTRKPFECVDSYIHLSPFLEVSESTTNAGRQANTLCMSPYLPAKIFGKKANLFTALQSLSATDKVRYLAAHVDVKHPLPHQPTRRNHVGGLHYSQYLGQLSPQPGAGGAMKDAALPMTTMP